ncbi:MAG: YncE family protein [Acidobacteria bacterium]|nr:YncE family protein [Acidobacteriota bacterium]
MKSFPQFGILAVSAVVCSAVVLAQSATTKTSLLVLSKHDHTLAIVDPSTLKVVGRVPVGDDPHEVVASADGHTAYVSNYGFGAFHTIAVVDLIAQHQEPLIDLGALRGPHGLVFQQGKVWFTAEAAKAIGSYDPSSGKVNWIMGTGQNRTHMLYVFPDGQKIVTANVNAATVTVLEHTDGPAGGPPPPPPPGATQGMPQSVGGPKRMPGPPGGDWNETVIPVGGGAEGFDVSPDGKQAWVANAWDGTISVIDIAQKKVTATVQANARGANRLKFTPDGNRALVSAGAELVVFDVATQKEVKRLSIGKGGGGGILVQPDGQRAYAAYAEDGFVAIVDLKSLEVVGKVDAGPNPDGLAWAVRE